MISSGSAAGTDLVVCAEAGATPAPGLDETRAVLSALNQPHASATAAMVGIKLVRMVFIESSSGVNAALADGVSHAINRQHVCRNPVVHIVGLGVADNVLEGVHHDVLKLLVDH